MSALNGGARSRRLKSFAPLFLALLCPAGLFACLGTPSEPPPPPPPRPDATLSSVHLTQWKEGLPTTRAVVATIDYHRDASRFLGDEVLVEPLDAKGQVESTLTARSGDGRMGDGLVDLKGDVRLVAGTDITTTDACTLDLRTNVAQGSLPVQLKGDGYRARGAGFTAETTGARRITLLGGVQMDIEPESP